LVVSMTKFVLGVNNCWAVKRYAMPREWIEITATKLDVKVVQFSFDLLDPRTKQEARDAMIWETLNAAREYGITIHSAFTGLAAYSFNLLMHPDPGMREDALDWYEAAIEAASKLNVVAVGGHVAAMTWGDYEDPKRRELMISVLLDELRYLSKLAKASGLRMLLWEPMPVAREPPSTISEAKELLRLVNEGAHAPVKLCIDVGHACSPWATRKEDLDPYAWLRELGSESPCVHIQQTDGKADRHWPFTEEYNKVGIIKPDKVLEALEESGSKENYLFLEIIHPFEYREDKVLEELKVSVDYWKEYVG